jgi:hypothetical protein
MMALPDVRILAEKNQPEAKHLNDLHLNKKGKLLFITDLGENVFGVKI